MKVKFAKLIKILSGTLSPIYSVLRVFDTKCRELLSMLRHLHVSISSLWIACCWEFYIKKSDIG